VRNILRGSGPVFNSFEKVEGYTNFLWMIILSFFGKLGISFEKLIILSQILGIIFGILTLIALFYFSNFVFRLPFYLSFFLLLLTSVNYAFCYWAVSGMETSLFTFFIVTGVLFFLTDKDKNTFISSILLGLSALTRPEGILVFILLFLGYILREIILRRFNTLKFLNILKFFVIPFIIIVFPHFIFRFFYYKSLLPNTFYAKTSFTMEYIKIGLNYVWRFLMAYGLFGIIFIFPFVILLIKRKFFENIIIFIVIFFYVLYIISVGGDTLQVYRFFVPILPLILLYLFIGINNMRLNQIYNILILIFLTSYFLFNRFPGQGHKSNWEYTKYWKTLEIGLVEKMKFIGLWLNKNMDKKEIFSASTIGAISFYADRDMIDLLGLTDSVIGRHPEHIEGLKHSWRERNYNSKYVLSMLPSYIVFSTGIKPSAAAERALFLWKRFRSGYYPYYISSDDGKIVELIYKRKDNAKDITLDKIDISADFPTLYRDAINSLRKGANESLKNFFELLKITPEDFGYTHYWIGSIYESAGDFKNAEIYYLEALKRDDYCVLAIDGMIRIYFKKKEKEKCYDYIKKLIKIDPDYLYAYYYLIKFLGDNKEFKDDAKEFLEGIHHKYSILVIRYI